MSESDVPARCAPYDEDLSAWLDGELDGGLAAAVRDHVEACARCTARVEELRAVDLGLRVMAAAAPRVPEAARLARLRARLAAEQAQLQRSPVRRAAPARRRRLSAALVAAAAAVVVTMLALPPLLERTLSTTEGELVAHTSEKRVAPASEPVRAPSPPAEAPAELEAERAEQLVVRPPMPTPGHLGASAEPGTSADSAATAASAEAPAARAVAVRDAASDDELDLALALDELEGVEPEDLAVVERLEVLERMAERGDGGPD